MNLNILKNKTIRSFLALSALAALAATLVPAPLATAQNAAPAAAKRAEAGSFDPYPFYLDRHSQPMMSFRVYNPQSAEKPKQFDTVRALKEQREMRLRALTQPTQETPASTPESTYSPAPAHATPSPAAAAPSATKPSAPKPAATTPETKY